MLQILQTSTAAGTTNMAQNHASAPHASSSPSPSSSETLDMEKKAKDQEEVDKITKKVKAKFEKKVLTFLKAKETLKKRQNELKIMQDDATMTVYPEPMKPYKASPTETELNEPMNATREGSSEFKIVFPIGTTRRKALEMTHHQMTCFHKKILVEASEMKVEVMRIVSRKETFAESIKSAVQEFYDGKEVEGLGLDQPHRKKPSDQWIQSRTEELYEKVVESAELSKKDADEKAKAEKEKRDKEEELAYTAKPEVLLKSLVGNLIDEKLKEEDEMDADDGGEGSKMKIDPKKVIDAISVASSKPKNEDAAVGEAPPRQQTRHWNTWKGASSLRSGEPGKSYPRKGEKSRKGKGKAKSKGKGKGYSAKGGKDSAWMRNSGRGSSKTTGKGYRNLGKGGKSGEKSGERKGF